MQIKKREIEPGGQIINFVPSNKKIYEIVFNTQKDIVDTDILIGILLDKSDLYSFDKERLKNIYHGFF